MTKPLPRSLSPQMLRQLAARTPRAAAAEPEASYRSFGATELFCPKCKQSMPVREKMLLVLPTGDLFDYCCTKCGTSVGKKQTGAR